MAQTYMKDSFLDLERHIEILEENVTKLRKSLQHWQTWSAEYEGLKEEILALQQPRPEDLQQVTESFEGELVTKSEIEDILGIKNKSLRNAEQIVNVLDRRIDYVSQNIATVEKQLGAAEQKLEKAAIVGRPDDRNEDGLPVMEIFEELDDEDNVVNGRVEAHGSSKALLEEVLKKAGVSDRKNDDPAQAKAPVQIDAAESAQKKDLPVEVVETKDDEVVYKVKATPRQPLRSAVKKTVNEEEPEVEEIPNAEAVKDAERVAKKLTAVMQKAEDLNIPIKDPIIPENESLEDAELRQQMLQYGMSEVGSVVAELDFEDDSDITDSGYDDEDEDNESLEEEDAFGRSTKAIVNDDIRAEMLALQEKLGLKLMANIGSNPPVDSGTLPDGIPEKTETEVEAALKLALTNPEPDEPESIMKKQENGKVAKKGVRFAKELDISPAPSATDAELTIRPKTVPSGRAPVNDIVERAPTSTSHSTSSSIEPPKKISKFKASRAAGPIPVPFTPPTPAFQPTRIREVPTGPANKTLSDMIVEKEVALGSAPEPDMHDPALLQQEVATEYYKKRNLMVQKQGGFRDMDAEIEERTGRVELTEVEGGPKKMSRFMAARLARQ